MKFEKKIFITLLIMGRILDLFTTYRISWGLKNEQNPLIKYNYLEPESLLFLQIFFTVIFVILTIYYFKNKKNFYPKYKKTFSNFSKYYFSGEYSSWSNILFNPKLILKKKYRRHLWNFQLIIIPSIAIINSLFGSINNISVKYYNEDLLIFGFTWTIIIIGFISFIILSVIIMKINYKEYLKEFY